MRPRVTPSGLIAVGAVFVAMSGTAVAANGDGLILGKTNKAGATTTLTAKNTPLSLHAPSSKAPLEVSNSTKVPNLNADLVDGLSSTQLRSASVLYRDFSYDSTNHVGAAACPTGWVAVGGGFAAAAMAVPVVDSTVTVKDSSTGKTIEGYAVILKNVDGTDYTGQASVEVRCEQGTSRTDNTTGGAAANARLRAALIHEARR